MSFEESHFDSLVGYLVNSHFTPSVDIALQQLYRVRRLVFGAYDPETGRRLITEWLVVVPKKNSKSTIAAGIMLTALILNWRQSAEFAVLAPTVEVANNAYAPARDMVQKDDELDALMHVQTHIKSITHRESGAVLKVLAADSNTVGGKKSVGTLVDELHLFGKVASAENMLREALGGFAVESATPPARQADAAEVAGMLKHWEQACRQKWRALALVIKAKLEAVAAGATAGTGVPATVSTAAMSPTAKTCGSLGSERSGPTTTRPARSSAWRAAFTAISAMIDSSSSPRSGMRGAIRRGSSTPAGTSGQLVGTSMLNTGCRV